MGKYDVVMVGAGPAGLIAAYQLAKAGKKILVLEARDRIGGRAYTHQPEGFSKPIEMGAEFVHGKLPITLGLLQQAGLGYHLIKGKSYSVKKGNVQKDDDFIADWDLLMEKLNSVEKDLTINDFLEMHFADDTYNALKESVRSYVQGFDSADPNKVSTISLRNEWENDDQEHQYRIDKGYTALLHWMANETIKNGATIELSKTVKTVRWNSDGGEIITADNQIFKFVKAIFSVPLGIWQASAESIGAISFEPRLINKTEAAKQMGYGGVIKISMEFTEPVWEESTPNKMKGAGFIFSDAEFPTWWTQNPEKSNLLTGWIAGPHAQEIADCDMAQIEEKSIRSLAYILGTDAAFIKTKLQACAITNWVKDPFALGAYSYETLQSSTAREILQSPVSNTLFFAGEALYKGVHPGTVEAAFTTGIEAATAVLS